MDTTLPFDVAKNYSSYSQQIKGYFRILGKSSQYSARIVETSLNNFDNNKPVADFYCLKCSEEYELKSKQGVVGKKIVNGAYSTMIERLRIEATTQISFSSHTTIPTLGITNFLAIPKYFFIPDIIEKRISAEHFCQTCWLGGLQYCCE